MNNRKHNCTNPYQGKAKRVLCVCSAGLLRSPTAANVLHREHGHNTRAAGLDSNYALIPVDDVLLHWADEIVCMDIGQKAVLATMLKDENLDDTPIISLGIDDSYDYMDEALQALINENYVNAIERMKF